MKVAAPLKQTTDLIDYVNKKVLWSNEVVSCVFLFEPNKTELNQKLAKIISKFQNLTNDISTYKTF